MKILIENAAELSNYEVLEHLEREKNEDRGNFGRPPGNLKGLTKRVRQYLQAFPSPLHELKAGPPSNYSPESMCELMTQLRRRYGLSKHEILTILNVRPENPPTLAAVLESDHNRWSEEQHQEILTLITSILGSFPGQYITEFYNVSRESRAEAENVGGSEDEEQ